MLKKAFSRLSLATLAIAAIAGFYSPANAAACTGTANNKMFTYQDLLAAIVNPGDTYNCKAGTDPASATISFTQANLQAFSGFTGNPETGFNWIKTNANLYTLQLLPDSASSPVQQSGPGSVQYSITLTDVTKKWDAYNTDFQGTSVNPSGGTRTTSLQGNNGTTTATYTNSQNNVAATQLNFSGVNTTVALTSSWVAFPGNQVFQKSDQFTLSNAPATSGVPGPLPIVGGGIAFAYSRRLRSRISKSVG